MPRGTANCRPPADPRQILIVGGGIAAQRCAFALRELGFDATLTLLAAESEPPYDRTLVSKDMLVAREAQLCVPLREPDAYLHAGIELRCGTTAVALDPAHRLLTLGDGTRLRYDRLVVCCGGRPVVPRAMRGRDILTLREARDVHALRAALQPGARLAIIGGGFIGGEVASAAAACGASATLIEAGRAPLAPLLGVEVGRRIQALHAANGVEVIAGAAARAVTRTGARFDVVLDDGRSVTADAVVVGVGMAPAIDWLATSGVAIADGILTDSECRTDVPGVFAAGDCARWLSPRYGVHMRVEHWDTAARHGAAAAAAALDAGRAFDPLPFFWSQQHGVRFQWVGYAPRYDAVEIDEGDAPWELVARYRHQGQLVGVLAADRPRAIAAARAELNSALTNGAV